MPFLRRWDSGKEKSDEKLDEGEELEVSRGGRRAGLRKKGGGNETQLEK